MSCGVETKSSDAYISSNRKSESDISDVEVRFCKNDEDSRDQLEDGSTQEGDAQSCEAFEKPGNDSAEDEDALDPDPQADDRDDDNYEITDFSMVTPWERLIYDLEEVLRKWGVGGGGLGSGWEGPYPATREHTILNSAGTKGVRHRRANVSYLGRSLVVRHVVWLPEGRDASTEGYCGVESIWRKRSSAATRHTDSHIVHTWPPIVCRRLQFLSSKFLVSDSRT
jgi:hypothetical protein